MKAVRVHDYGPSDRLRIDDVPCPRPAEGGVLIKVSACGVNPLDAWFRSGHLAPRFARPLPYIPGSDVAGTIAGVGDGVAPDLVGTPVLALTDYLADGGYADYAVTSADRITPLPSGLDPAIGAALPTPTLTGAQMIDRVRAHGGRAVLILGALGSVGRAALFEARRCGLRIAAVVRPERAEEARALGIDTVLNADTPDRDNPAGDQFDAIVDTIGPAAMAAWLPALRSGGLALSVVPLPPASDIRTDVVMSHLAVQPDMDRLQQLAQSALTGALTVPPLHRLPLERAALAHDRLLLGNAGGKFVLLP